ncbi:MAG TPA: tetratricopeptide repeat protein [Pseudomonadales bacterium]
MMVERAPPIMLTLLLSSTLAAASETVLFNESAAFECYQAALHDGGEYDIESCSRALEYQALTTIDRAATHSNRGILYARIGDIRNALRDHNRAVKLAPEVGSIYINRSNTLVRAKRYEGAMRDLEKAIEIADDSLAYAHYNRALLFQKLGDLQAARADAEQAAEIAPDSPAYRRFLAAFGETEGDPLLPDAEPGNPPEEPGGEGQD